MCESRVESVEFGPNALFCFQSLAAFIAMTHLNMCKYAQLIQYSQLYGKQADSSYSITYQSSCFHLFIWHCLKKKIIYRKINFTVKCDSYLKHISTMQPFLIRWRWEKFWRKKESQRGWKKILFSVRHCRREGCEKQGWWECDTKNGKQSRCTA